MTTRTPRHAAPKPTPRAVVLFTRARVRTASSATILGREARRRGARLVRHSRRQGVRLVEAWRAQSVEQRRLRTVLGSAALLSVVVLATSFPLSELLTQRGQLTSDAGQLATLQQQDAALTRQVAQLRKPSTIEGLARQDYGLVRPGQKTYTILPPSTGSSPVTSGSDHVPLDGPPVVPGSVRAQQLNGVPPAASPRSHSGRDGRTTGARSGDGSTAPPPGFWSRVVRNLEFWH